MKNKRYCVSTFTKKKVHLFRTDSIKVAKLIFNLKIWGVAKITDEDNEYETIAYIKRREI